jgi:polyhydroxybutyrate depolymerase
MSGPNLDRARALRHDGRPRRFLVHRPAGRDDSAPLPVVVALHGAGGTAAWTLAETGWADKADREGFLLVLPEGLRPDLSRPPHFLDNPQVWNDGSPKLIRGEPEGDDVGFLDAVLDAVAQDFPANPRRIYVTGFSNGGGMVFRLGAERSRRFAALAPVAGHCWLPDPRPERPPPTLFLAGGDDPLFPLAGGEIVSPWDGTRLRRPPLDQTLRRWAAALGFPPGPPRESEDDGVRTYAFQGREGAEFTARIIPGLGHHWPGGRGQFNPRLAGRPSDRLSANDVIWEFFKWHSLP